MRHRLLLLPAAACAVLGLAVGLPARGVAATKNANDKTFVLPASHPATTAGSLSDVAAMEQAFVDIADRVGPAVVSVVASYTVSSPASPWGDENFDEFFRHFFEAPPQQMERQQPVISAGSGVIVTTDGYILTNAHVVGQAKNIKVKLLNKKEYPAKLMGKDEDTDIAVLKIVSPEPLTAAALADSDKIHVGQWAIAIGNPFGLENTMTVGVISAKGRKVEDPEGGRVTALTGYIQTDASINRGNSGGPLINIRGEVMGINTMIFSPSGGSVGIGFAIPINIAKSVMEGLIREGRIVRPQLGVMYRPIPADVGKKLGLEADTGMEVSSIIRGSAADKAGLKPGDILVKINGKPLKEADDLRSVVLQEKVGGTVTLSVFRKGRTFDLPITLQEATGAKTATGPARGPEAATPGDTQSWLGMEVVALTDDLAQRLEARDVQGIVVAKVDPDSPAANAGLQPYDIVREIEQQPVADLAAFAAAKTRLAAKSSVLFLIERQGATMYLIVERGAKGAKP